MSVPEGFDEHAGRKMVYPNNMPIRGYQRAAVEMALYKNAMLVLPTGFGKTFIAAVVMYNFHRWYPQGKLIFVAPTRPLVAQQIDECKRVSGIPASDCIELTGSTSRDKRCMHWKNKRVFFATPQVIENDLNSDILPADQIRCLVIDEAHRAQGGYAYVNIVSKLQSSNRNGFRILALSATPGTCIERVKQVILNLYINDVMFRTEDSFDLAQFRNKKSSRAWTAELRGEHKTLVEKFIKLCDPIFKPLHRAGLTYSGDSVDRVAKYTLLKAMQSVRENSCNAHGISRGKLTQLCAVAMALSQKFESLTIYGLRVFYSAVTRSLNESNSPFKTAMSANIELEMILQSIRKMFGETDAEPDINKPGKLEYLRGHPKLAVLQKLLNDHFEEYKEKTETRAIVFTKYRESVYDIVQTLKAFSPIIIPCAFVGQGKGLSTNNSGMSQREQIQVISDFKAGKYNVLVATCVAEEGLDIGEVDLIVCYDTSSSPISNTQRRGRTGRKRSGNVHTILTKDFEEKKMQKASTSRRHVESELFKRETYMDHRYRDSPRMVPDHIKPEFFPLHITPINDVEEEEEATSSRRKPKRKRQTSPKCDDEIDDLKKSKQQPLACEWDSEWDED